MTLEQIIVLALVQGITEFLPISSSGHLILVPVLTGWRDQGLLVDVMAHVGSLAAIIAYFWRDVVSLMGGGLALLRGRRSDAGRMLLYIAAATVPAVVLGLILKTTGFIDAIRGPHIVAWNAIVFALLMLAADRLGAQRRQTADMTLWSAMAIGAAQALALVPGTSRSGVTMTAARFLGYERVEAARFSFLLSIPAVAGAGALIVPRLADTTAAMQWDAFVAGASAPENALTSASMPKNQYCGPRAVRDCGACRGWMAAFPSEACTRRPRCWKSSNPVANERPSLASSTEAHPGQRDRGLEEESPRRPPRCPGRVETLPTLRIARDSSAASACHPLGL